MSRRSPIAEVLGWIMIAAGVLIALTAGLCSNAVYHAMLTMPTGGENTTPSARNGALAVVLIFGGAPALVGAGLVLMGWLLLRTRWPDKDGGGAPPEEARGGPK